jgi:outer membrane protein assembly factor BamB
VYPINHLLYLVGDEIYFVTDSAGMVTCLDAHTGKEHWRERIGGNYSASPLHSKGRIFFHSREGKTTVIQAGKEFKVLSENHLDGQLMASAAADNNALFLRTDKALYRIEE